MDLGLYPPITIFYLPQPIRWIVQWFLTIKKAHARIRLIVAYKWESEELFLSIQKHGGSRMCGHSTWHQATESRYFFTEQGLQKYLQKHPRMKILSRHPNKKGKYLLVAEDELKYA